MLIIALFSLFVSKISSLEEQLNSLTSTGLEIEGNFIYESILGSLEGVIVGKVLKCFKSFKTRYFC